ncbi:hypothetical protein [Aliirhizobium cellulosilyticum]|uniref:Uncharacterized protein n=1 Tax=Aliirhizobium cellulosilyticum TaxID=393664 RepID=A0A7W6UZ70_9HYPH|nr:hypothetical protein [Rhizobium cellulosilyticum]MBB4349366.1 hypothetical protein [Rhizobium cellulosilyticum]MBB4412412.1 hypothetical protein [Rhizobium cellulosilyticum]MBB4447044.1 hypothetical protein [Rhizobium cellulosilyticum]
MVQNMPIPSSSFFMSVVAPTPVLKEQAAAITVGERTNIIQRLSSKLTEMSEIARLQQRYDLHKMYVELSKSFLLDADEIAAAGFGPLLIEKMSHSVSRLARNFSLESSY